MVEGLSSPIKKAQLESMLWWEGFHNWHPGAALFIKGLYKKFIELALHILMLVR